MLLKTTNSAASPGRQATLTAAVTVAVGDLIIVESQTAEVYTTVSDSFASTWSTPIQNTQSNIRQSITWAIATQAGSDTISVNTGNGLYPEVLVTVFSGMSTSSPQDGSAVVNFPPTAGLLTGGNITPAHDGDLLIGFVSAQNMTSFTQQGSNAIAVKVIGTGGSPCGTAAIYRFVSGTTAVNLQVTVTNSNAPENAVFATLLFKSGATIAERGGITADQIRATEKSGPGKLATFSGILTKGRALTVNDNSDIVDSGIVPAAQTPWTQNVNAGGFTLSNVAAETITNPATTQATLLSILQPSLANDTLGSLCAIGTVFGGGTLGYIAFKRLSASSRAVLTHGHYGVDNILNIYDNAMVGINKTTAAAYALDVVGDINCTGSLRVNGTPLTVNRGVSSQANPRRLANTVYQNTGDQAMMVSVSIALSDDRYSHAAAYVDADSEPATVVQQIAGGPQTHALVFWVLPSYYYQVETDGEVMAWTEWTS